MRPARLGFGCRRRYQRHSDPNLPSVPLLSLDLPALYQWNPEPYLTWEIRDIVAKFRRTFRPLSAGRFSQPPPAPIIGQQPPSPVLIPSPPTTFVTPPTISVFTPPPSPVISPPIPVYNPHQEPVYNLHPKTNTDIPIFKNRGVKRSRFHTADKPWKLWTGGN